jgi:hypothetical protein
MNDERGKNKINLPRTKTNVTFLGFFGHRFYLTLQF